jgi:hypothetical protein
VPVSACTPAYQFFVREVIQKQFAPTTFLHTIGRAISEFR